MLNLDGFSLLKTGVKEYCKYGLLHTCGFQRICCFSEVLVRSYGLHGKAVLVASASPRQIYVTKSGVQIIQLYSDASPPLVSIVIESVTVGDIHLHLYVHLWTKYSAEDAWPPPFA